MDEMLIRNLVQALEGKALIESFEACKARAEGKEGWENWEGYCDGIAEGLHQAAKLVDEVLLKEDA